MFEVGTLKTYMVFVLCEMERSEVTLMDMTGSETQKISAVIRCKCVLWYPLQYASSICWTGKKLEETFSNF